jgi:hypothetical protein
MLICSECLASERAKFFVQLRGSAGTCESCGCTAAKCLQVGALKEMFEPVMKIYGEPIGKSGPLSMGGKSLGEIMDEDGLNVFDDRVSIAARNTFLNEVMLVPNARAEDCWYSPFGPADFYHDPRWERFASDVIRRNRYIFDSTIPAMLEKAADANPRFRLAMNPGSRFYRAQNHGPADRFSPLPSDRLTAPPAHLARAGRANSSGIPVLYVADEISTAIAEVRPFVSGYVSVALCTGKSSLFVFDLTAKIDVSGQDPCEPTFTTAFELAILTAELDRAFAEPVAPFTPERDYAPTQIVAELLKKVGFSGVKYRSELQPGGINYAFFDPRDFLVQFHESYRVTGLEVTFEVNEMPKRLKETLEGVRAERLLPATENS